MTTPESAPTLTFGQFSDEYLAAALTLARKDGVDPQTRQELNGSINFLCANYPDHLQLLHDTVAIDIDI